MQINIDIDEKIINLINQKADEKVENLEDIIYKIVENVLEEQNICVDIADVSIQCMSQEEIRNINNKYRKVDRATDVLSFPIFTKDEFKHINDKNIKELELGDIILCLDIIERQATEYGTGILREVLYMITHGVCHLVGYDHEKESEKKEMRALEEKVLSKVGVGKVNG